jgi:hypothetical protein
MIHRASEGAAGIWVDGEGRPLLIPIDVNDETGECLCAVPGRDGKEQKKAGGGLVSEWRLYRLPLKLHTPPPNFDAPAFVMRYLPFQARFIVLTRRPAWAGGRVQVPTSTEMEKLRDTLLGSPLKVKRPDRRGRFHVD